MRQGFSAMSVFPLKLDAGAPPEPTTEEITRIREARQRNLRTKTVEELRALALAGGPIEAGPAQRSNDAVRPGSERDRIREESRRRHL